MNIEKVKKDIRKLSLNESENHKSIQCYLKYYNLDFIIHMPNAKHKIGYIHTKKYEIAYQIFHPPKNSLGTILIIHGYYDHMGLFSKIIQFFVKKKYTVCIYDLPGHGLSSGKKASIDNFSLYTDVLQDIITYCKPELPVPWHAYGQSTGSAIMTDFLLDSYLSKGTIEFDKIILAAPLIRPCKWTLIRIKLFFIRPFIKKLNRIFTNNSSDTNFLKFCRNDPLAPEFLPIDWITALDIWIKKIHKNTKKIKNTTYIIQGTNDKTVDAYYNIPFLETLYINHKTLWINDAKHHLANEKKVYMDEYMHWLSSYF